MGRKAKIKADRKRDRMQTQATVDRVQEKARVETAERFLRFLESVRRVSDPGITFFDPSVNTIQFVERSTVEDPEVLVHFQGVDFLLNRVVAVKSAATEGWNMKLISMGEVDRQIAALQDVLTEAALV